MHWRGGVRDAELHDGLRVVAAAVEFGGELEGKRGAAQHGHALDGAALRDRHDARDDRNLDAGRAGALHKFPVMAVVEKQLGDQKVEARVDFAFQIVQIDGGIAAFDVLLGISGAAEQTSDAVAFPNEGGKFGGIAKPAFDRGEGGLSFRRIAAQRQDVADAGVAQPLQNRSQFFARRPDAGEMSHGLDARALADTGDDFDGFFARGAAGSPCDGDECGPQVGQIGDSAFQLGGGFVGS